MDKKLLLEAYKGKRVLVTGHTGFKGSWLCSILKMLGAQVVGYALEPNTEPSLFELANVSEGMTSVIGDVRDLDKLKTVFDQYKPEYVFHLAAQPIVRESYRIPVDTYSTNVMGTVNLMECVRLSDSIKSVINITTDKVYENTETERGYVEDDKLDGYDPYSNSKSCSELVTHSYVKSFLNEKGIPVSTCRAGNVIGGGDFEKDRIIPDCVRAVLSGNKIIIRNPNSVRPYQHVLDPLFVYLFIAQQQLVDSSFAGAYNIGPDENDAITTGQIVEKFCSAWGRDAQYECQNLGGPHEAGLLMLNCDKIRTRLEWEPVWNVDKAIEEIVEWTKAYQKGENIIQCMMKQIKLFYGEFV